MSGKIEISRELAERIEASMRAQSAYLDGENELQELLAAPVVERQEPVAVVLDERKEFNAWYRRNKFTASAETKEKDFIVWQARACLDKVKELNQ